MLNPVNFFFLLSAAKCCQVRVAEILVTKAASVELSAHTLATAVNSFPEQAFIHSAGVPRGQTST
jgi:hypothetical protein